MKLNPRAKDTSTNTQGVTGTSISTEEALKRVCYAHMLFENSFYISGIDSSKVIEELCKKVEPDFIIKLAEEIAIDMRLRHTPLFLLVQAMKKKGKVSSAIQTICTRPDMMTDLLALYWKEKKTPLAKQLQRGLAKAFLNFDEYQLAKWNRSTVIKLKDVLKMVRPKPVNDEQSAMFKRLLNDELKTPDTWEVRLSRGDDKKETFKELIEKKKLSGIALLRNLRNCVDSGVDMQILKEALKRPIKALPFQFLSAAREAPTLEAEIDEAMLNSVEEWGSLPGKTCILVDVSGSMISPLSEKSTAMLFDAASSLAILLREVCEEPLFATFSYLTVVCPNRRGMALRDILWHSQPNSGTDLHSALLAVEKFQKDKNHKFDRLIIITDEQSQTPLRPLTIPKKYIFNVGNYQKGLGNNHGFMTITGFTEAVIKYVMKIESWELKEGYETLPS
jgi:hypothetical protein